MSDNLNEKQVRQLVDHMNDYLKANQLLKKGEAVIYDKHRLADGGFGPGLNDDLKKCRTSFANEWGVEGWRNEEFVKKQMSQAPGMTEEDIQRIYEAEAQNNTEMTEPSGEQKENADEFREGLAKTRQRTGARPKMG